ncbi:F-box/kelch-repeat protein At3g06240-like [Henckelia pumila]|uniref:F-box/kelch-repeat protein At3g06240-like n=1 Tax=Henckelia pumila TaxID=405737 RepID=UPI003C6E345B
MDEPWLPMDVFIEILIFLPVKSILKFKCVSKTWRDLISSPLFMNRHLKCHRKHRVMLVKGDPSDTQIHGPCNGLVCIALGKSIFLCNPALREFKQLPPLNFPAGKRGEPLGFGFGFDQIGGGYKFIQIWGHEVPDILDLWYGLGENGINENQVDLYDSASDSWKRIDAKVPYVSNEPSVGVYTNGAIHWYTFSVTGNYPCILCFDTTSEAFRELHVHGNFPPAYEKRLIGLDGSLAMVLWNSSMQELNSNSYIETWVMKEYGVKESWTKRFCLNTCHIYFPLLIWRNEWLVFVTIDGQLAASSIRGNQSNKFEVYGFEFYLSAVVYEESLVSLMV